jgi:hypothetical protein
MGDRTISVGLAMAGWLVTAAIGVLGVVYIVVGLHGAV